jgi:signal transduction histidine kinase
MSYGPAFVEAVVRRHGGRATVSSEPGQGSHFCLPRPTHTG